ncbi:DUF6286 domain-containing protein [Streptomyces sp. NPDC060232]|uniref:DUF6286 domain-containing protein n=1 Tax=Streptomyces sp. NPDC060232 TaxID=3347079 RepID=UPI003668272C
MKAGTKAGTKAGIKGGVSTDQDHAPARGVGPTRRPWSARRIPAALTALVVAAASGALLFDIGRVRAGGNAAAWRTSLAYELAARPLDDVWMQVGAAALTLLGLWLIVLALTPGLRHRYPLESPDARVRAVLDRDAAVLLLRDAALRVPGVSGAKVRMRRHRVAARADVRFRSPAEVRADLVGTLREQIDRLGLADPPGLSVRTRSRRK